MQQILMRLFALEEIATMRAECEQRKQREADENGEHKNPELKFVLLKRSIGIRVRCGDGKIVGEILDYALLWIDFDDAARRERDVLDASIILQTKSRHFYL